MAWIPLAINACSSIFRVKFYCIKECVIKIFKRVIYIYNQWRSKVPKSVCGGGGAHRHVIYVPSVKIYVPSVKNQYKRVVIGYMVIY